MKVCCVFSLESPHRGDSNEYTQYTIFIIEKGNQIWGFSRGTQELVRIAVVNEPSVFEPLKVCYICSS